MPATWGREGEKKPIEFICLYKIHLRKIQRYLIFSNSGKMGTLRGKKQTGENQPLQISNA